LELKTTSTELVHVRHWELDSIEHVAHAAMQGLVTDDTHELGAELIKKLQKLIILTIFQIKKNIQR